MTFQPHVRQARTALLAARDAIASEMRFYPTPVSGCDAQYNHLVAQRSAIADALRALDTWPFVATPRTPHQGAGVESR